MSLGASLTNHRAVWIAVLYLLFHPLVVVAGAADDGCGPWLMAEPDSPAGEEYLPFIQLRSCEMTRGISAFLQIQNSGSRAVKLVYQVHTLDKFPKEGEIIVKAGKTIRAGTCQACTTQKGGIQSWQITLLDILGGDEPPAESAEATNPALNNGAIPVPKDVGATAQTDKPVNQPQTLSAEPADAIAGVRSSAPPVNDRSGQGSIKVEPQVTETSATPATGPDAAQETLPPGQHPDGLVTEDGKIIPWDQVPVEFRPKSKR